MIDCFAVQWASRSIRNRQSLHPTFTHGSTLGLYEVLVGKPFITDMITDSVIHCFFIEADKIYPLLKAGHDIEEFLWQVRGLSYCTFKSSNSWIFLI